MPSNGAERCIVIRSDGTVRTFVGAEIPATAEQLPPHGDLIDRDDLKNKEITIDYAEWGDTFDDGLLFVTDLIDNAPTIIPTEENEE